MPSSVVGSIAGSVASAGVSKLLGGGGSGGGGSGYAPFTNVNAGGLYTYIDKNGNLAVAANNKREALTKNMMNTLGSQAAYQRGLVPTVQSNYGQAITGVEDALSKLGIGFGDLTKARVGAIQNAGTKAESDLRANLARRRVLGSSFANDDISRTKAEFAQQEAEQRAKSYLEELDANTKLIETRLNYQKGLLSDTQSLVNSAYSLDMAKDQTQLDELNAQLSLATGLIQAVNQRNQENAAIQYQNALNAGKTAGSFTSGLTGAIVKGIGNVGGSVINNLGQSVGSIFSSSPTGPYLPFGF